MQPTAAADEQNRDGTDLVGDKAVSYTFAWLRVQQQWLRFICDNKTHHRALEDNNKDDGDFGRNRTAKL